MHTSHASHISSSYPHPLSVDTSPIHAPQPHPSTVNPALLPPLSDAGDGCATDRSYVLLPSESAPPSAPPSAPVSPRMGAGIAGAVTPVKVRLSALPRTQSMGEERFGALKKQHKRRDDVRKVPFH